MNINNLTFLDQIGGKGAPEASGNNLQSSSQGMNEEFLALLGQELNPESLDTDIMEILKDMPVEDVNKLVKTLSEEVNAQNTLQENLVSDLLSQFKTKDQLVKAMEENPKLVEMVKNLNEKIIEKNHLHISKY
jgi:hypothetical protein